MVSRLSEAETGNFGVIGHADRLEGSRALVRDRGSHFIEAFDEVFRTENFKILKTPVRTPVANTFAERWIASIRRELLDRTIVWHNSNASSATTSLTTTSTGPTNCRNNDPRHSRPSRPTPRQRASRCSEPPDAPASSTATKTLPDLRRHTFRAPQGSASPALSRALLIARLGLLMVSGDKRDAEILALRHQIRVLQRQIDRPRFSPIDRTILSVLSRTFDRAGLGHVMLIVKPAAVIEHGQPIQILVTRTKTQRT